MAKAHVYVVPVSRRATFLLLVLVMIGMASLFYFLAGKAYVDNSHLARMVLLQLFGGDRRFSGQTLLAALMPVVANVFLYVPWGFLMFVLLDRPTRPRRRSYAIACCGGLILAAVMQIWQAFLPTRVTTLADALANTAGAVVGAALGHLRKEVRFQFE